MKFFLPIIGMLLSTVAFGQLSQEFMTLDSEVREYYEYVPQNYDNTEKAPLIIVLHGIGGFAADYAAYGLNDIADTARFIPVYLQGSVNVLGQTSWNNGVDFINATTDDLLFISSVIDSMHTTYNINRRKVYVVGISMGAIMSFKAIRHLSDKIAGTVCHIGTMSDEDILGSNPDYQVPTMQVHGTLDAVVPYDSNPLVSLSLVPTTIDKLKTLNGWNGSDSTIVNIPDTKPDGVTIERIVYDCNTPLEHWKMLGADHIFLFDNVNDTSGMIITWNFLNQFTHPNVSLSTEEFQNNVNPIIYPNPTTSQLFIENFDGTPDVKLYDLNGRLLIDKKMVNSIDISALPTGIYTLVLTSSSGQTYQKLVARQ